VSGQKEPAKSIAGDDRQRAGVFQPKAFVRASALLPASEIALIPLFVDDAKERRRRNRKEDHPDEEERERDESGRTALGYESGDTRTE